MSDTQKLYHMRENNWKYIVLLIVVFIGTQHLSIADPKEVVLDSLWQAVKTNYKSNPEIALDYATALHALAIKNDDQEQASNALFAIGYINYMKEEYSASLEAYFKVLSIYQSLENDAYLADTYKNIGNIFSQIKIDNEARRFYLQALPLYLKVQKQKPVAELYYLLGKGYVRQDNFEQAEIYLEKGLKLSKNNKQTRIIYNWLGVLFRKKGKEKEAIDYYQKSLTFCKTEDKGADKTKAIALLNLGIIHLSLNELDQAKSYGEQSLVVSATLAGLNKTIKPQILLTEIAVKRGGTHKNELLALINTLNNMDATVFNTYYNEALLFVGQKENINLLTRKEMIDMNMRLAAQLKISTELYEDVKRQLNNHALQMVMNKIKTAEKLKALENEAQKTRWSIVILLGLFLGMAYWRFAYLKRKKGQMRKKHEEIISEVKMRLSFAKKEIANMELADIASAMILEEKNEELLKLEKENVELLETDEDNNQLMIEMITDISNAHILIEKINAYIKYMREFMEENGLNVPPPPPLWDIGDERDN